MSDKTVAQKLLIKPGMTVAVLHAPAGVVESMGADPSVRFIGEARGAEAVLLFAPTQADFVERFEALQADISPTTRTWVLYPRGSKAAGHDISRDTIWTLAERMGMRPLGLRTIDDTWSAFGFRLAE